MCQVPGTGDWIFQQVVQFAGLDYGGSDSAISTGESTATTSISSSVFEFTYANGRRYHSDRFRTEYFMPNDENEQARLDLYHHIFLQLLSGKLCFAPLNKPQRVLDVGTGTGIWAIEFADDNPQAEVIGTDISPIQPSWVPPNCKFEVDDMEEPWTYDDDYFDYIHMRCLSGSFCDWESVLRNAYDATKPGGYLEFQDYGCELFTADGVPQTMPDPKRPFTCWLYHIVRAAEKIGRPLVIARSMKELMERAGFVDVIESTAIWPIGAWPKDKGLKEIGKWGALGITDSLYPFAVRLLTKGLGWSKDEVIKLCGEVENELPKSKYYFHGWFVYGRKPENSTEY
ncbi:S-adenosyl-L-methionine-dependent methyltransferase [Terfezia boudieri ATCC MYA-4762]|uniref:S-adenosyl-L-methionine-dependent methyltransferase n=1 Tax=Terfezia boudieri ATCC MYA-4762 TaxID=1051890 RepID=A0A3N4LIQ7_9PEZI|nr:S-adenosyl-L-methionine-dependent methyltransferase [Terfezia boudieri ATCC MYA-4762]